MKKTKKIMALVLATAMAVSMVGCGKDSGKDTTTTSQTASNSDATIEGATAAVVEDDFDWVTTEVPVVEDNRFTTVEGADAMGLTFDDDTTQGFVSYTNGGQYDLYAENGQLVCDIKNNGALEHACQAYFDGFTMARGCVYTLSFDISCSIERSVDWRVQINGGDYHAYATDTIKVSPDVQTVTCEFTMEDESDPAPRFVFNMGKIADNEVGLPQHQIYVDNISLFVTDSSNAEVIEGAPTPIQVKVNQIGYDPDDVKTVSTTSGDDERFKIVDAATEETVYIGEYGSLFFDKTASTNAKMGDFSDFKIPGTYKIISSPSGASYEFSIGDGLYDDIYKDVVLMLYKQRCGTNLDASIAGNFAHEACHMEDAIIFGDDSGKTVDVSGGWHDAGDYGRYVVAGAKPVMDLMLAYEDYAYDADDIGLPESGNGVPDLLDEAKYELDWMLKMQNEEGGVYHKVTGLVFPETVEATAETEQMVLAPVSFAATADFAAVMAKASVVYADYDADFAATCLEAAKKAFDWTQANESKGYKNPEEIVTGEYPDGKLGDEKLWSAAELYVATGDDSYKAAIDDALANNYKEGLGWADIGTYALYDLAKNGDEAAKTQLIETAQKQVDACAEELFFAGLSTNYPWGSNMTIANNGEMFLMAYNLGGGDQFLEYAKKQRDYIFGFNAVGYCFVTGYGSLSPESTHHRPSQVLNETMPGMLVGGPDNGLEDPYAHAVLYGTPAALCYVDNSQSFSCNEITIYWNSPLIYLLTGVEK